MTANQAVELAASKRRVGVVADIVWLVLFAGVGAAVIACIAAGAYTLWDQALNEPKGCLIWGRK